jgi:hypothetical protein
VRGSAARVLRAAPELRRAEQTASASSVPSTGRRCPRGRRRPPPADHPSECALQPCCGSLDRTFRGHDLAEAVVDACGWPWGNRFGRRTRAPVRSSAVACPSGLRSTPRKRVRGQLLRGFKSHRHRSQLRKRGHTPAGVTAFSRSWSAARLSVLRGGRGTDDVGRTTDSGAGSMDHSAGDTMRGQASVAAARRKVRSASRCT